MITSLLNNAVEAIGDAPDGKIQVQTELVYVSANDVHLWHYTNTPLDAGQYCRLMIQDNGVGIENEALPKIFDPFYTTKPFAKGLGLSAVLGLVRGHNAGILVENRLGGGSRFGIYLPL